MNFQQQCKDFGYKEVVEFLKGRLSQEEMIEKLKMETRRYAKRQITWFKKNKQTFWLDGEERTEDNVTKIIKLSK